MIIEFGDDRLDALETDPRHTGEFSQGVVKAYRRRIAQIRAARDERDLYGIKSLHFERLIGTRQGQHSIRLNDQYRLILEIEGRSVGKTVRIIGIEDYHQ